MDNLPPRKSLFVYTICLLSLIPITKGDYPDFFSLDCPDPALGTTSTYAPNSTYKTNLNTLFSTLSSHSNNTSNGFYNFTAGTSLPDIAYGLFLCRGDISSTECQHCVAYATQNVVEWCPKSKRVTVWLEGCMLRYSNEYIFARQDRGYMGTLHNVWNITDETHFNQVLGKVHILLKMATSNEGDASAICEWRKWSSVDSRILAKVGSFVFSGYYHFWSTCIWIILGSSFWHGAYGRQSIAKLDLANVVVASLSGMYQSSLLVDVCSATLGSISLNLDAVSCILTLALVEIDHWTTNLVVSRLD
ncbi:hypothetical protein RHMOL_Rhmol13G0209900 [Rhododendron molle]|uniref:Uncharacterized protein n=1 Tax=Rhododendron molle TaxID=49168 RepID=A0ACC0L8Z7_RHOML|nr:hypothetical protein RHMOL_Rhmol13G0209900 [Rhododendron molle]